MWQYDTKGRTCLTSPDASPGKRLKPAVGVQSSPGTCLVNNDGCGLIVAKTTVYSVQVWSQTAAMMGYSSNSDDDGVKTGDQEDFWRPKFSEPVISARTVEGAAFMTTCGDRAYANGMNMDLQEICSTSPNPLGPA